MIAWQDFWTAVALVLVVEGIVPFLNPRRLRRMLAVIDGLSDGQLRAMGAASMAAGVIALYVVKH